jgi:hypothetical protein
MHNSEMTAYRLDLAGLEPARVALLVASHPPSAGCGTRSDALTAGLG